MAGTQNAKCVSCGVVGANVGRGPPDNPSGKTPWTAAAQISWVHGLGDVCETCKMMKPEIANHMEQLKQGEQPPPLTSQEAGIQEQPLSQ